MNGPGRQDIVVGLFVGGESSRMGQPKGLLRAPHDPNHAQQSVTLVERLFSMSREQLGFETVLVGRRPEYEHLPYPTLADACSGAGPLGGLVAALTWARSRGHKWVVAVACDLPYLSADLLERLACHGSEADVLCPRSEGKYQPLFARYAVGCLPSLQAALDAFDLSLQSILTELGTDVLALDEVDQAQLVDWDRPEDVPSWC